MAARTAAGSSALHAHDGYAHPLAYLLLHSVIAPEDENDDGDRDAGATTIQTDSFSFDHEDGTNLKRTSPGRETIIVDRNHHGAVVHHPPAFADGNVQNSVVGLDATVVNTSGRLPPGPISIPATSTKPLASVARSSATY